VRQGSTSVSPCLLFEPPSYLCLSVCLGLGLFQSRFYLGLGLSLGLGIGLSRSRFGCGYLCISLREGSGEEQSAGHAMREVVGKEYNPSKDVLTW
jgi:hypothetical protein